MNENAEEKDRSQKEDKMEKKRVIKKEEESVEMMSYKSGMDQDSSETQRYK